MSDPPAETGPLPIAAPPETTGAEMESFSTSSRPDILERIDRLEDAVAALCQERTASGLKPEEPPLPDGATEQTEPLSRDTATSRLAVTTIEPGPASDLPANGAGSGSAASVEQYPPALPAVKNTLSRVLPPSSLLRDIWWDMRTAYRMVRDPLYPMSLACKIVPIAALLYVTIWPWFSTWTGMIGTVLNGLVYVVVFYVTFKIVHRELRRYYEFATKYQRP
jgi:hypothetical protein